MTDTQTTAVIVGAFALIGVVVQSSVNLLLRWWSHNEHKQSEKGIAEVHVLVNSAMEKYIKAVRAGARGEGKEAERDEERQRQTDG